ncbi:DNA mismatch repair protein MutS [Lutispora saccharofermentans]|uniref:DNA mismatch repair protein MutS n=1 Tax=Lutispora saccharofermentans TaxID=3024236 RepID=A0ABT1NF68_9FIRM|nr:DNA mismatch repair protein MutS [Lutispora saccharofermentans]MCQ1529882.1 DNA mismatch repair protein MutS [Lutispora saccharofermentans]
MSQLTPMMQQYMEIKNQHKDKILFFRLGDFYEMFFDDAITASRVLEITLTGRDCGMEERAPMCGIPYHAADAYISKLIENNFKIAICEQVEDPALAKGIVKREVIKVITPGTITSSLMLDDKVNNYLMSVYISNNHIALSYIDLSTGEFFATITEEKLWSMAIDEINRINPSEMLLNIENEKLQDLYKTATILDKRYYELDECTGRLKRQFNIEALDGIGLESEVSIKSAGSILLYLDEVQKNSLYNINKIKPYNISNYMVLDQNTRRNLELCETIRERSKKGSLLSVLDRTNTSMGARMLRQWVEKPLLFVEKINERLDAVSELLDNFLLREELKEYLNSIYDIERLGSRIALGTANAKDLIAFKNSLTNLPYIKAIVSNFKGSMLDEICRHFDDLKDLYEIIDLSINEDPPFSLKEGNLIKDNYMEEIDKYKKASSNGKQWIIELEQREKQRSGIKSLKIGYNKVFGYFIEVTKSNIENIPEDYIRKQTLSNAERYITPELKELEETVLHADEKLIELEYEIFVKIREEIGNHIGRIQETAQLLATLDCLCSYAEISQKNGYIKPVIGSHGEIEIKDGRHPVVEAQSIKGGFVPNDTLLDCDDNRLLVITGPNMAGKSTYMRQIALIVLMAQIGCFVPASYAKIGVVDRIFTRVGASDDLASGQSTFMVEMTELANIINSATDKSLVVLDEIGRGTSTFDGLSLAWSTVEYISDKTKLGCKTLFATHYHELTELESKLPGIKNYYIAVEEKGKDIIFLRKIKRGSISGSYGIHVARLAGVPEEILERAYDILEVLDKSEENTKITVTGKQKNKKAKRAKEEINLFNYSIYQLAEEIKNIDLDNLTPIEALNKISMLKDKAKHFYN